MLHIQTVVYDDKNFTAKQTIADEHTSITSLLHTYDLGIALRCASLVKSARDKIVDEIEEMTKHDRRDDVCSLNAAIAHYRTDNSVMSFNQVLGDYTRLCLKIGYTQAQVDDDLKDFILSNNL